MEIYKTKQKCPEVFFIILKGWKSFYWLTMRNQAASMKSCIVWIFLKLYTAQSAYEAVFDLKLQLARFKKGEKKLCTGFIEMVHSIPKGQILVGPRFALGCRWLDIRPIHLIRVTYKVKVNTFWLEFLLKELSWTLKPVWD